MLTVGWILLVHWYYITSDPTRRRTEVRPCLYGSLETPGPRKQMLPVPDLRVCPACPHSPVVVPVALWICGLPSCLE